MGWAKYEEDNREALEERWALKNAYRPTAAYGNDHGWRKQSPVLHTAATYPSQGANSLYVYRTAR